MYKITMHSENFGSEIFSYDTLTELYEGLARIAQKCAELNDGILRAFTISDGCAAP